MQVDFEVLTVRDMRDRGLGEVFATAMRNAGVQERFIDRSFGEYAAADAVLLTDSEGPRLLAIGIPLSGWPDGQHELFRKAFSPESYVAARIVRVTHAEASPPAYKKMVDFLMSRAKELGCAELGVWAPAPEVIRDFRQPILQGVLINGNFETADRALVLDVCGRLVPFRGWRKSLPGMAPPRRALELVGN